MDRRALVLLAALGACAPAAGGAEPPAVETAPLGGRVAEDASAPADGAPTGRSERAESADAFPLAKGTYWVYEGVLRYERSGAAVELPIVWRMEVVETIARGPLVAARLKGHPQDLPFSDGSATPGDWLLLSLRGRFFALARSTPDLLKDLRGGGDPEQIFNESAIFASLPPAPGGRVMGPDGKETPWTVERPEEAAAASAPGIAKLPPGRVGPTYKLVQRTLADTTSILFTIGVGITGYEYIHNGTLSEVELRLIEHHAPSK